MLEFTSKKSYDKGHGWVINYTCGNWSIVNVGSCWVVSHNHNQITTTKTLKEAKANVLGCIAFNEEMI